MKNEWREPWRFWSKVQRHPSGCLQWTGGKTGAGYGISANNVEAEPRMLMAHRQAYILEHGNIIEGIRLVHAAPLPEGMDYKVCVNHEHWRPETAMEWLRQPTSRHNAVATHCKNGHEFTPENTRGHKNGGRVCRQCNKIRQAAFREARGDSNPYRKKAASVSLSSTTRAQGFSG